MKPATGVRNLLLTLWLAAGNAAFAQIQFNITVGPPAPLYEAVPAMAPGYVWAPGYWAWNGERHIWVHGRSIFQRPGYRWQPDVWEQRNNTYYRNPGRWERDSEYRAPEIRRGRMPQRGDNRDQEGGNHEGGNHEGGRREKGAQHGNQGD